MGLEITWLKEQTHRLQAFSAVAVNLRNFLNDHDDMRCCHFGFGIVRSEWTGTSCCHGTKDNSWKYPETQRKRNMCAHTVMAAVQASWQFYTQEQDAEWPLSWREKKSTEQLWRHHTVPSRASPDDTSYRPLSPTNNHTSTTEDEGPQLGAGLILPCSGSLRKREGCSLQPVANFWFSLYCQWERNPLERSPPAPRRTPSLLEWIRALCQELWLSDKNEEMRSHAPLQAGQTTPTPLSQISAHT